MMKFFFIKLETPAKQRVGIFIGLAFIVIGLLAGLLSTWQPEYPPVSPTISQARPATSRQLSSLSGTPVRIQIPSASIDLKVIPGYYYPETKSWTLSINYAQYGVMTPLANDRGGATFIYGHYRKGVFMTLPKILPGDQAIISTDNQHTFTYVFLSSKITSPSDTSLFSYSGKPVLILQTCSGLWYQNRQLFTFGLVKAV